MLSSCPLGKILTGLVQKGIQNPGPQRFQEVIERGLAIFTVFLYVFLYVLTFFQKHLEPTESLSLESQQESNLGRTLRLPP